MTTRDPDPIDARLSSWRQGDCVVGSHLFIFRGEAAAPVTEAAEDASGQDIDTYGDEVRGLVVLTQTCDILRSCRQRPFVEVSPLVAVEADKDMDEIRRQRQPRFAFIAGVADQHLVADLDRVMTVEKATVARWQRRQGCLGEDDQRLLRQALCRKRARTAFPDDFIAYTSELQERLKKKHARESPEGRALQALREIRVRAAPSWGADSIELTFYFVRDDEHDTREATPWDDYAERWLGLLSESDEPSRFGPAYGVVVTLDDITGRDYVESDLLDLDYLSAPRK